MAAVDLTTTMDCFHVENVPAAEDVLTVRAGIMKQVEEMCRGQVQWHETENVAEYRRFRAQGIGFPKVPLFEGNRTVTMSARDGHRLSLRVITNCDSPKGTVLHFHAGVPTSSTTVPRYAEQTIGGFVIGSAASYDVYLAHISRELGLIAVSVEYRLAPEHPFPTAQHDAEDAALFALSDAGATQLGGPLRVLAGESAGGYLAAGTAIALRDHHAINVRERIVCVLASYPICDLLGTPSLLQHKREAILSREGMLKFIDAYLQNVPTSERGRPDVSILYAHLQDLPPALFLCGTQDPLVDDSVFMATRWALHGSRSHLILVPGAWHAFTIIPAGEVTDEGNGKLIAFARKELSSMVTA